MTAASTASRIRSVCNCSKTAFKFNEHGYRCLCTQPAVIALLIHFPRERHAEVFQLICLPFFSELSHCEISVGTLTVHHLSLAPLARRLITGADLTQPVTVFLEL